MTVQHQDSNKRIGLCGSVFIQNFKAFGSSGQYIPLAPLNLFFGRNSVGKSCVFQALRLVGQYAYGIPSHHANTFKFSQTVFRGNFGQEIVIGLLYLSPKSPSDSQVSNQEARKRIERVPYPCFHFVQSATADRIELARVEIRMGLDSILTLQPRGQSDEGVLVALHSINTRSSTLRDWLVSRCPKLSDAQIEDSLIRLAPLLTRQQEAKELSTWLLVIPEGFLPSVPSELIEALNWLFKLAYFALREPAYLLRGNLVHLPAIRRIPSREDFLQMGGDSDRFQPDQVELRIWENLLFPEKNYGKNIYLQAINRWLSKDGLDFPYRIERREQPDAKTSGQVPAYLVLKDIGTPNMDRVDLNLTEVGTGISQVIPVLGACCIHNDQWILIEQPELHLHPAAECRLADVFIAKLKDRVDYRADADGVLYNGMNVFFLETHSEHLMLRLLRRVRETTAEALNERPHLTLRPEDLSVVYFEPNERGTRVSSIDVTDDGDFADRWPQGFFEEREEELF